MWRAVEKVLANHAPFLCGQLFCIVVTTVPWQALKKKLSDSLSVTDTRQHLLCFSTSSLSVQVLILALPYLQSH